MRMSKTLEMERCCACDADTGRAGEGEDSLYTDGDGPFCDDCYEEAK